MGKLVYLVGLPASGKSTYAKEMEDKGYIVHSSDSIRKELYGDENEQGKKEDVFSILHRRISDDLKSGKDCVYDSTGISSKRRMAFLNNISHIKCDKICVLFATPYEICLKRNQERDRKVPEEVIKKMYMNFNIPYYYEGWDEIQIIWSDFSKNEYDYFDCLQKVEWYNQNNSHHSLTLGGHLLKAFRNSIAKNFGKYIKDASQLHDISKPFTATFFDIKGNKTEDCHYYGHENVSAYDSLFILKGSNDFYNDEAIRSDGEILYICSLINLHMKPYTWKEEKTKEKYKKLLGVKMYSDLMNLHYCDVNAH